MKTADKNGRQEQRSGQRRGGGEGGEKVTKGRVWLCGWKGNRNGNENGMMGIREWEWERGWEWERRRVC